MHNCIKSVIKFAIIIKSEIHNNKVVMLKATNRKYQNEDSKYFKIIRLLQQLKTLPTFEIFSRKSSVTFNYSRYFI